jgi:hypothetical protein
MSSRGDNEAFATTATDDDDDDDDEDTDDDDDDDRDDDGDDRDGESNASEDRLAGFKSATTSAARGNQWHTHSVVTCEGRTDACVDDSSCKHSRKTRARRR